MKKGIINKIVTTGLIVSASIGLSACSGNPPSEKKEYQFYEHDTTYDLNEQFSIVGTKLKIKQSDGSWKHVDVTAEMIKGDLPDMTTAGTKTVTILYEGVEYTFSIEVVAPVIVTGFRFTGAKINYGLNESFDISNLKLVLSLSNNDSQEIAVTSSMISAMPDMSTAGQKTVTITHNGATYNLVFTVLEEEVTITGSSFSGYQPQYVAGSTFDISNLKLVLSKNDGTTETVVVTSSMISAMPDMSTAGTKTVVVNYNGVEYTLTFEVVAAPSSSEEEHPVVITGYRFTGNYDEYNLNSQFNVSDLVLVLTMSDGTTQNVENITKSMIETMPDMSTVGTKMVVVLYEDHRYSFTFEVADQLLTTYVVGYKTSYKQNETFSLTGIKLAFEYLSGTQYVDVTENMVVNMPNMSTTGLKMVTITYLGETYTFKFDVVEAEIIEKIEDFINNFELNADNTSMDLSFKRDLVVKYLGDTATIKDKEGISPNTTYGDSLYDPLSKHIYDSVLNGLVSSSTDLSSIKFDQTGKLKAELDKLKALQHVATELSNYDYVGYMFDAVLPYEDEERVAIFGYMIADLLEIDFEENYEAVVAMVEPHYNNLRYNFTFNMEQFAYDFIQLAKDYSERDYIHIALNDIDYSNPESLMHICSTIAEISDRWHFNVTTLENALENYDNVDSWGNCIQYDFYLDSIGEPEDSAIYERLINARVNRYRLLEDALINLSTNNVSMKEFVVETLTSYAENEQEFIDVYDDALEEGVAILVRSGDRWYTEVFDSSSNQIAYEESYDSRATSQEMASMFDAMADLVEQEGLYGAAKTMGILEMGLYSLGLPEEAATAYASVIYEYYETGVINEDFLTSMSEAYGIDFNTLVDTMNNNYEQTGMYKPLTTIYDYFTTGMEFEGEMLAMMQDYRALLAYIDENGTTVNAQEFNALATEFFESSMAYYETVAPDQAAMAQQMLYILTNITNIDEIAKEYATAYRDEIVEMLYYYGLDLLDLEGDSEVADSLPSWSPDLGISVASSQSSDFATEEWYALCAKYVDAYIDGTFDIKEALPEIHEYVDTYCDYERKVYINSSLVIALTALNNGDVDYNELLSYIELPEEIGGIDYNQLIATILNGDTYKNMSISDIKVDYITNEDGEITGETMTIVVDVNYDLMITSVKGSIEFSLTYDFDAIETIDLDAGETAQVVISETKDAWNNSVSSINNVTTYGWTSGDIAYDIDHIRLEGETPSALRVRIDNVVVTTEEGEVVDYSNLTFNFGGIYWSQTAGDAKTCYLNHLVGEMSVLEEISDRYWIGIEFDTAEQYEGDLKISYDIIVETAPATSGEVWDEVSADEICELW